MKSLSFLGLIALSLQCMGIWPFVTRNRTLYLLNLFFRLFCCFCWAQYQFGVLANIFLTEDDITEITKMISLDLAVFNVSVKATPLVLYRDYYLQLKEKVDRFVENEMKHSEKNYQLIYKKSKSLNFLAKCYIISVIVNALTYCVAPLLISKPMINNGTTPIRRMPLPARYPWDFSISPYYELTYAFQFIATPINALTVTVGDLFFCALILFNSIQYECLANNLKDIPGDANANKTLAKLVLKHREIIWFSEELKKLIAPVAGFECAIVTVQSSFIIFAATVMPSGPNIFSQLVFLFVEMARLYLFGWYCSGLIEKSQIGFSLYETEWYNSSKYFKSSILFMMIKLQKPVKIMALKIISISLELCLDLTRASYSFYTVMSGMD